MHVKVEGIPFRPSPVLQARSRSNPFEICRANVRVTETVCQSYFGLPEARRRAYQLKRERRRPQFEGVCIPLLVISSSPMGVPSNTLPCESPWESHGTHCHVNPHGSPMGPHGKIYGTALKSHGPSTCVQCEHYDLLGVSCKFHGSPTMRWTTSALGNVCIGGYGLNNICIRGSL